jgi:ferredoxin
MKTIAFSQSGAKVEVKTESNVLQALLAERVPVKMACGGRGMCATCHVYIERGADGLTPRTKKEDRTLGLIGEADPTSRLACQAKVLRDGVLVRLPKGLYIERTTDLKELIGRRATERILHPISGKVLVEEGKSITKSTVDKLSQVDVDMQRLMTGSLDAG